VPRRNRHHSSPARPVSLHGAETVRDCTDGVWMFRAVSASAAAKPYRCPGCNQTVPVGVAHIVAWPCDDRGGTADRRHWHSGCWRRGKRDSF
jgi:hypothetical protein